MLNRKYYKLIIILFLCLNSREKIFAATDPVKLMSYNLLNYPDNNGGSITADTTLRNPFYRTIIAAANPDIFVAQEVLSLAGVTGFLNNVMNKALSGFAAGTFIDGFDTDNGIFYKASKFIFISNTVIKTELRDINEFKLKHILSGDTIRIYSLHLKASSTAPEAAQRAREVDSLRKVTNALPLGSNFIVCGDYNIYNSTEVAYVKLKEVTVGNEGHFIDPLNMSGNWNQIAYAAFHTQSPRIIAFGGGSTGGMDDRFDMILYSKALSIAGGVDFSAGSMVQFGNDGLHYNDSINRPPNLAVGQTVADALYFASDHIPVTAIINFNFTTGATSDFGVQSQLAPVGSMCPKTAQSMQVVVKNYGATTVDFSSVNLPVEIKVTDPASVVRTYNKTISSGTITAGSTLTVTFDSMINMSLSGTYSFKSYTKVALDVNLSNDTNTTSSIIFSVTATVVTPGGSIAICNSNPVMLTSTASSSYSWSNGATTSAISVSVAGNYFVSVTNANGCTATSNIVTVSVDSFRVTGTLYAETFGAPTATTVVNTYTGWRNGLPITYSSTSSTQSDVRFTNKSSLVNPIDSGNVFMGTASSAIRNFIISGINTLSFPNPKLSFGLRRESSGTDTMLVEYSTDGGTFFPVYFTQLSTSNNWFTVNALGSLPSITNLRLRFSKNSLTTQFRIDDVTLTYSSTTPTISASGPTTFCAGGSVTLNASTASAYLWSNGLTTQNIIVTSSGTYSVVQTSANGCTATSNTIAVTANPNLTASVSVTASPSGAVCAGAPVTFTAAPTNGGALPIYTFKVNNVSMQSGSGNSFTSSLLSNNDSVRCEMAGNNACTTPATAISNNIKMIVNPNLTASVSISASPSGAVCSGIPVTFTASPVNGGASPIYNFIVNNVSMQSGSGNSFTTSLLSNNDSIRCEMAGNNACTTPATAISNNIKMIVNPNLTASVSISASPSGAVCSGTPVTFTASPINGGPTPSYNFKVNNVSIQSGSGNSFTTSSLTNNDSVRCEMAGNNTCTTPATAISNSINGIVNPVPSWYLDNDSDGYYNNGTAIIQCNTPGAGYTTSIMGSGDCNDSNAFINPGVSEICANNFDDNCNGQVDDGCAFVLTLKVFIEGFYLSNGMMITSDTVLVELHDTIAPYVIADADSGVVAQNGIGIFNFSAAVINSSYYIVVRHRNSVETWSKDPVIFNNPLMNFDFTAP